MEVILSKLFINNKFKILISRFKFSSNPYTDTELRKDFEQELILQILLCKNREKLRQMYRDKELDYFILGVAKRLFLLRNSDYNKKYRRWESIRETYESVEWQTESGYRPNIRGVRL